MQTGMVLLVVIAGPVIKNLGIGSRNNITEDILLHSFLHMYNFNITLFDTTSWQAYAKLL